jgi:hypothetical protein
MDQVEVTKSSEAGRAPAGSAEAQKAWQNYYQQASLRRRARGGRRHLRDEKRRRRFRERLGLSLSALLIAGMTGAFYLVLMR